MASTDAQADQCDARRATISTVLEKMTRQLVPVYQQLLPKQALPTTALFADAENASGASKTPASPTSTTAYDQVDLIAVLSHIEQETSDMLIRNLSQALPKSILRPNASNKNDELQDGLDKAEEAKRQQFNAGSLLGQGPAPPVRLNVQIPGYSSI